MHNPTPTIPDSTLLYVLRYSNQATVVFISRDLHIGFINQAMLTIWNKTEDVLYQRLEDVAPEFNNFFPFLQQVWDTGETRDFVNTPATVIRNGELSTSFYDFQYRAVKNDTGQTIALINTATDVTARMQSDQIAKQREEGLAESNLRLQFAMEAGALGATEVVFASGAMQPTPQFKKNYGRNPDEPFSYAQLFESILPEYREIIRSKVQHAIATRSIYTAEYPIRWPDGSLHWIAAFGKPRYDENGVATRIVGLTVDITERVFARQGLEESEQRYRTLSADLRISRDETKLAIDAAALGTFDLDPASGNVKGNHLLKSWFGLGMEEEVQLQQTLAVIDDADKQRVIAAIDKSLSFKSGGSYEITYTIIHPQTGERKIVRAIGQTTFDESQQPVRLSGVLQDVTEQKKDEQRKNDFIAMVSHELKTPLTSLLGYVQLLQYTTQQYKDADLDNALERSKAQVKKMNAMINGFLNVSRLESGKIHLQKQTFRLDELLEETIKEVLLIAIKHPITCSSCPDITVEADRDKIGQVITNLLSNATKYASMGTNISVECTTEDNNAIVVIHDQGIGISEADQAKLFDRFFRVEGIETAAIGGFGIGLYVSAEIISRHGGKIWVKSTPGKGSSFYFSLPMIEELVINN